MKTKSKKSFISINSITSKPASTHKLISKTTSIKKSTPTKISTIIKKATLATFLILMATALCLFPQRYITACFQGITLWATCVLPSLFPFMVITLLLISSGITQTVAKPLAPICKRLHLNPISSVIFLMSIISGYPAGSRIVAEYYNKNLITQADCKKLSILCSTSSPLFIVGTVGYKMFQNTSAGYKILIAHILSVVIIALIYSLKTPQTQQISPIQKQNSTNILYESFSSSVMAVLIAGGFISFFYTTATVVTDFNILYPLKICLEPIFGNDLSNAICYGIIEATGGCAQIAQINSTLSVASSLTIPTTGFLITFGGLSILLQQLCYLTSCGIKPSFFIATKFLQATLCFLTLFLLCL